MLTVGSLRKLIENVDDDVRIVFNGSDHTYQHAHSAQHTLAVVETYEPGNVQLGEWTDDWKKRGEGEVNVVVIS